MRSAQDIMRVCRYESGMTLAQLSEATDKDINTLYKWENGKHQPHWDSMINAIHAMGYEIEIYKK